MSHVCEMLCSFDGEYSICVDDQIKIVSWFLHQEGSLLTEIITRLSSIYGTETVDIKSVSLFLQSIEVCTAGSARSTEQLLIEDIDTPSNLDELNHIGEYTVLDDILKVDTDNPIKTILSGELKSEKKKFKSRRKVICSYCDKVHVNKYTLDTHITTHHNQFARACSLCGKLYGLAELLHKHIRVKHGSEKEIDFDESGVNDQLNPEVRTLGLKCGACDEVFRCRQSLESHSYVHHTKLDKTLFCDLCGKCMRSVASLERHKLNYHSKSPNFKCSLCSKICSSRVDLKQHLCTHGFVCNTCCLVFATVAERDEHASAHQKTAKCTICEKSYMSGASLKLHMSRMHSDSEKYACKKCNLDFFNRTDLKRHTAEEHGTAGKSVCVCDVCGKSFSSGTKLRNHTLYEHQHIEKPYSCNVCNKGFAYKHDQARHQERHSAVPSHSCQSCDKKFFTKYDMQRHVKVVHDKLHAGACEVCGRKFQSVGGREWTQHMNAHAGIKNISCHLCTKSFSTDETLKCHMISHFDTMYWSCSVCCKSFKRIKNVKYHLRVTHALTDKVEIRRHCVKLRSAPTKAEIQQMSANKLAALNTDGSN